jgi:glucose-1-phosphate cytidylyltransferase
MKTVILAGGLGTRLSEETVVKPKPMVEIGGKPILWHIIKIYSHHGIDDFVICLGYKGYLIKEYFANYALHMSDVTFHMAQRRFEVHQTLVEPWKVTLVDTGDDVMTGGRLRRARDHLRDGDFCLTYGDGVANVDISALVAFHKSHGKVATVTSVRPLSRYGSLDLEGDAVRRFVEKPAGGESWINGGFFVLSPRIIDYIEGDHSSLEADVMQKLSADGQLMAFRHDGYWQSMDTLRDRNHLEAEWASGRAQWKVW